MKLLREGAASTIIKPFVGSPPTISEPSPFVLPTWSGSVGDADLEGYTYDGITRYFAYHHPTVLIGKQYALCERWTLESYDMQATPASLVLAFESGPRLQLTNFSQKFLDRLRSRLRRHACLAKYVSHPKVGRIPQNLLLVPCCCDAPSRVSSASSGERRHAKEAVRLER